MKYYLLDEHKNLVEGFDKEGFLTLLEQAIEQGSLENIDEDSAVASKIRSILNGTTHHIEFVTQAQYNQLVADEELVANTMYFITDDNTSQAIENHLTLHDNTIEELQTSLNNIIAGNTPVGEANYARTTSFTHESYSSIQIESASQDLGEDFDITKPHLILLSEEYEDGMGRHYGAVYSFGIMSPFPTGRTFTEFHLGTCYNEGGSQKHTLTLSQNMQGNVSITHKINDVMDTSAHYKLYYKELR